MYLFSVGSKIIPLRFSHLSIHRYNRDRVEEPDIYPVMMQKLYFVHTKGPVSLRRPGPLKVWDVARHTLFPSAGIGRSRVFESCQLPDAIPRGNTRLAVS